MPSSAFDWMSMEIPINGELSDGATYYKHGAGCEVSSPEKSVDFDFGKIGEVGLFDSWRLEKFAAGRLKDYGFENYNELETLLKSLASEGLLVECFDSQYLVSDEAIQYANEVDGRRPDDTLPLKSTDPVITLYAQQFLAADLMRSNYKKIITKWKKDGRTSRNNKINARIYLTIWLGFLRVICEGFEKLPMRILLLERRPEEFRELVPQSDLIGKLKNKHNKALVKFRNNTFHSEVDFKIRREFFDINKNRIQWAHELHEEIEKFFSSYRILCEVHYFLQGRLGESEVRRSGVRRRRQPES